jgi:predicted amidohydrolase YtcJ
VREGHVIAVGKDRDVLKLKGARTELVDLQGRMMLPGLMDSHTHPTSASMTEFDHPIPDMESIQDVLDYFAARAKVVKPGEWIVLQQVFITRCASSVIRRVPNWTMRPRRIRRCSGPARMRR